MAGPECCVPAPPCQHACTGSEESFGPFFSYLSHPSSATPTAAVILVSDVFGFESPLLRKLADKIASSLGYLVVVPDYFNKDPFSASARVPVEEWKKTHEPMDFVEGTISIVETLKNKGIFSTGAVGFCWGAKVVVELAKRDYLKVAVLCHPSFASVDDFKDVKTPIAILAAETDRFSPPDVVMQYQEILESRNEVQSFVKIYPGTSHGWVIRYNIDDAREVEKAEEAHDNIFEWLKMYLW
ncbi:hypothetical protein GOP47_0009412 [Adiantum capillus-veneris]|uniref:Dienelactone hydrolase domain-containing protein n=1 Tax=Adiantum capillus-veneris TaxID=13818 RepID=A0A9D4UWQ7_ADICA|nr:hypothetical protein GOP47_0009412 [Adiantum capillus-veneris]